MSNLINKYLPLCIVFIVWVHALLVYPYMPKMVASHWGRLGMVDSYMPRFGGTFLIPIILSFLYVLFLIVLPVDSKKENIHKMLWFYRILITMIFTFLLYMQDLVLAWNLGYEFKIEIVLLPVLAMLFYGIASLITKFDIIGIRMSLTLSDSLVQKKTQVLASLIFKIISIVTFLSVFFGTIAFEIVTVAVIIGFILTFIYTLMVSKTKEL
jgi:uncharacterized membrane protein